MGRDYSRRKKYNGGRIGGGFSAIPHDVLDSPAFLSLSFSAKALLLELARQYLGNNNGKLICTEAKLQSRGWKKGSGVITRAKRELLQTGLIFETCKGARPNKASWYALTWYDLEKLAGYDPEAENFKRRTYADYKPKNSEPP